MEIQSASPTLHSLRVALLGKVGVGKRTYIQKLAKRQNQHIAGHNCLDLCKGQLNFQINSNLGPCQVTLVYFDINLEELQTNQQYAQQLTSKLKTCSNDLLMFSLLDKSTKKYPITIRCGKWLRKSMIEAFSYRRKSTINLELESDKK